MTRLRTRPSPAMIVACVALSFALAGSAVAGTGAVTSDVSKRQAKKIAKKQAKKQIRKKAPGLHVRHADTAGHAETANHAFSADKANFATEAGKAGTVLQSAGGNVNSPAGTGFFTANTLGLPAGTYLVWARAAIDNDAGADHDVTCRLVVGTQTDTTVDLLEVNGDDDTDSIALMVPSALAAAGTATFQCNNPGGAAGDTEVDSSRIVALPINAVG